MKDRISPASIVKGTFRFLTREWFILPALAIYLLFMIYPMVDSLIVSLHKWDGLSPEMTFVGLKNYVQFFQDEHSLRVLLRTFIWTVTGVVLPTAGGLFLAVALNRKLFGRTAFRGIFYSAYVLPLVALGIVWAWIYNPNFGALNAILKDLGLSALTGTWLSDPNTAFGSVIATNVWWAVGFPMVLFLAGLQTIPKELYEAAWIDGASWGQSFRHITIPQLKETFVIVIALLIINGLKSFQLIYVMTWGGPARSTQVLGIWMYFNTFLFNKAGFGSAVAWIMTVLSLGIAIPYIHFLTRDRG